MPAIWVFCLKWEISPRFDLPVQINSAKHQYTGSPMVEPQKSKAEEPSSLLCSILRGSWPTHGRRDIGGEEWRTTRFTLRVQLASRFNLCINAAVSEHKARAWSNTEVFHLGVIMVAYMARPNGSINTSCFADWAEIWPRCPGVFLKGSVGHITHLFTHICIRVCFEFLSSLQFDRFHILPFLTHPVSQWKDPKYTVKCKTSFTNITLFPLFGPHRQDASFIDGCTLISLGVCIILYALCHGYSLKGDKHMNTTHIPSSLPGVGNDWQFTLSLCLSPDRLAYQKTL